MPVVLIEDQNHVLGGIHDVFDAVGRDGDVHGVVDLSRATHAHDARLLLGDVQDRDAPAPQVADVDPALPHGHAIGLVDRQRLLFTVDHLVKLAADGLDIRAALIGYEELNARLIGGGRPEGCILFGRDGSLVLARAEEQPRQGQAEERQVLMVVAWTVHKHRLKPFLSTHPPRARFAEQVRPLRAFYQCRAMAYYTSKTDGPEGRPVW